MNRIDMVLATEIAKAVLFLKNMAGSATCESISDFVDWQQHVRLSHDEVTAVIEWLREHRWITNVNGAFLPSDRLERIAPRDRHGSVSLSRARSKRLAKALNANKA